MKIIGWEQADKVFLELKEKFNNPIMRGTIAGCRSALAAMAVEENDKQPEKTADEMFAELNYNEDKSAFDGGKKYWNECFRYVELVPSGNVCIGDGEDVACVPNAVVLAAAQLIKEMEENENENT